MRLQVQMGELFGRLADLAAIYLTLRAVTSRFEKETLDVPCINCHRGKCLIVRHRSRAWLFYGLSVSLLGRRRRRYILYIPIDGEEPQNKQSARLVFSLSQMTRQTSSYNRWRSK